MPSISKDILAKLKGFVKAKTRVTLQVKDLEPTLGVRHFPEEMGGDKHKLITGTLYQMGASPTKFTFLEDNKTTGQDVKQSSLSKIQKMSKSRSGSKSVETTLGGRRRNCQWTKKVRRNSRGSSRRNKN